MRRVATSLLFVCLLAVPISAQATDGPRDPGRDRGTIQRIIRAIVKVFFPKTGTGDSLQPPQP
jgi:hypothetical protein